MIQKCPKCGAEREQVEGASEGQCPKCGVIYARFKTTQQKKDRAVRDRAIRGRRRVVTITLVIVTGLGASVLIKTLIQRRNIDKIDALIEVSEYYTKQGVEKCNVADFEKGISYLDQASEIAKRLKNSLGFTQALMSAKSEAYSSMGRAFGERGDHEKGVEYHYKAYQAATENRKITEKELDKAKSRMREVVEQTEKRLR